METAIKIKGFWWLPETPENKISGELSFSPNEPILLELMGSLKNIDNGNSLRAHDFINPPIIHGNSLEGEPVTIEDCAQIGDSSGTRSITITKFTGSFIYVGVHFANLQNRKFKSLLLRFKNLDEWFCKKAFDVQHQGSEAVLITYKQPVSLKTTVGDYHFDFVYSGPDLSQDRFTHVHLSQEAWVNIWTDSEKDINEFLLLIRYIQNFLTLAISSPTFITEMKGNTESAKDEESSFYYPVKIYYPADGWRSNAAEIYYFRMMFTLPEIEGQLEKILERWISKAEIIKPVYDLYFAALYNPSIYQEFEFLSLAQAIETYHRLVYGGKYLPDNEFKDGLYKALVNAIPEDIARDFRNSLKQGKLQYANEYSLRKRLILLSEHIAQNININFISDKKSRELFADKLADTRNYFTHYSPELKDKAAKGGKELHDLIQKMRLIIQVCFLEELGFSFNKIKEVLQKNLEFKHYFSDATKESNK